MQQLLINICQHGRSPHGERGLKLSVVVVMNIGVIVALLMESVD